MLLAKDKSKNQEWLVTLNEYYDSLMYYKNDEKRMLIIVYV